MLSLLVCRHVVDRLIVMSLCYDHYYYSYCHLISNKNVFSKHAKFDCCTGEMLSVWLMRSVLVCRQLAGSTETGRDRELWGRAIVRIEIGTFSWEKNAFFWISSQFNTPPHSGPGGRRINLSKWTKSAKKCKNITLTIVFHKNGFNFNVGFKKG